jgi:AmmeMemoRadiSam system protein B
MVQRIRPSIIAGQWYPGDAAGLRRTLDHFFDQVSPVEHAGEVVALISPHAGYAYSGQTAAHAYAQVRAKSYDVVAIVSPVHSVDVGQFAVTQADAYETPLGLVPVDAELVRELEDQLPVHRVGYDGEHSLEIQLPFLQVALGAVPLLPVMVGARTFEAGRQLGKALAEVLRGRRAIMVASTDLHHIADYAEVVRRDRVVADAIRGFDLEEIRRVLSQRDCSVCGRVPTYAVLSAARDLGADHVEILHQTTSGDVTGMRVPGQYTVGYLAAAVYRRQ